MARLPDPRTFRKLFALLGAAPRNIAAISVGDFRVEFRAEPSVAPAGVERPPSSPTEKSVDLVPGTIFPDDGSPLNPIDLVLTPPTIDGSEN